MNFFLKIKHWQFFGILLLLTMGNYYLATSILAPDGNFDMLYTVYPILMVIFSFIIFGWIYSIGIFLETKLPPKVFMLHDAFRVLAIVPLVYIVLLMLLVMWGGLKDEMQSIAWVIMIMHLFSFFCVFYSIRFVAKELKAIELNRPVKLADYLGDFFLICLLPIGIWIIQPKINALAMS